MNSQDAAILILRAKYLNQLRPKPKGIIANRMVENIPRLRSRQGESKRNSAKKHQIPTRKDESHKTRPSYRAAHGPAPDIAVGIAIPQHGMQIGGPIAQGVQIVGGAQAVGVPVGAPVAY